METGIQSNTDLFVSARSFVKQARSFSLEKAPSFYFESF